MENFVLEPTELANERPDLQFEDGTFTIPEILDSHLLPLVVQYDCRGQAVPFNKFHFDLTQPLLLYKKRNIQKVAATSLHIQDEKYKDLGESLLIPEDYKGWFAVLQRVTGCTKADDNVPHFFSIEELANSNTEKFLIGGTKKLSGLQILDRSEGQIKHDQKYFFPGDALTIAKVEYGEAKKRTRLFRKPKYIREKFLLCTDESDREILLPFDQQGIFYQISHKSGKPTKNVMQMSDIVARKLTPRIIKLVFGRFPTTPCAFTGLMKAESSRIETSVIASTIVNQQNILMEIPINNELIFKIAVTNDDLRKNPCYRNAMHFCAERASTYMRNIKICYNFTMRGWRVKDSPMVPDDDSPGYVKLFKPQDSQDSTEDRTTNFDTASTPSLDIRNSDISDTSEISLRPNRCTSLKRMSLCFGNSYLTVPLLDTCRDKRNSGNNNTVSEVTYTTKRGSKISFNGKFMEMEGNVLPDEGDDAVQPILEDCPPPMPCTNICSYVNSIAPPKADSGDEFLDYIPTSSSRRPSSQPPDTAPPPIPLSSSTSGVSSGSLSSMSDDANFKRASSDSCEYHVPKTESSASTTSGILRGNTTSTSGVSGDGVTGSTDVCLAGSPQLRGNVTTKPTEGELLSRVRRPSTYTFVDGCKPASHFNSMKGHDLVEELEESSVDVDSPIYENIQSLMEVCKKLDIECGHIETNGSASEQSSPLMKEQFRDSDLKISFEESDGGDLPDIGSISTLTLESYKDSGEPPTEYLDNDFEENACCLKSDQSPDDINNQNEVKTPVANLEESIEVNSNEGSSIMDSLTLDIENSFENTKQETVECESAIQVDESNKTVLRYNSSLNDTCSRCDAESEDAPVEYVNCGSYRRDQKSSKNENVQSDISNDCNELQNEFKSQCNIAEEPCLISESDKTVPLLRPSEHGASDLERTRTLSEGIVASGQQQEEWMCAKSRLRKTKSFKADSMHFDSTKHNFPSTPEELCQLTTTDVCEHFKTIGIRDNSLSQIEQMKIDGVVLNDILNGEKNIRESMEGVTLIDQQKISMYIRGWRPQSQYN